MAMGKKTAAQLDREIAAMARQGETARAAASAMEPGLRAMARRSVDAEGSFLRYAMERGRLSEAEARVALAAFRKARVIKFDAVNGTFHVTHGAFLESDVLRRAAGVEA